MMTRPNAGASTRPATGPALPPLGEAPPTERMALGPPPSAEPTILVKLPHVVEPDAPAAAGEREGKPGLRTRILQSLRGYSSVRTRVLAAMLVLSALGLLLAGATAYALQRNDLNSEMDESLARSFQELETLLATGIDPDTLEPFVEADQLVYLLMQRTLTQPNEGMMAVRGDQVIFFANEEVDVRLEDDPELVNYVTDVAPPDQVTIQSVSTAFTDYRVLVAPVMLANDTQPTFFVLGFDAEAEHQQLNRTFGTYALISFATLALIGVVGFLLVGKLLDPIRRVRTTAQRITDTDLSQRIEVTGNDDLSDLTRTVNAMLDRLEGSFTSQRQLLDDVGHELRTPITIVQGHLELQDSSDPRDVQAVRDIALDELDRMRLLVDDLVTLAGIAGPNFVRPEPVNLGRLTDDVMDKARTLGARRWIIDSRAEAIAVLDPRRITQAWLQLVANSVKFTEEGTTIAIGSRKDDDGAWLWVRDEGTGIAREDQKRIFDRFERGPSSKRTEGAGLGLTIVSAITEAHGGAVELRSAPGQGSTFTMAIPSLPLGSTPTTAEEERP
ncbi:HAMP domain-containing sensor histidine kinase [Arthrobacter sp. EH-1B-1]|uniref:histidine kinase n=1 Tax=Arthrobacter vasquezii TaxID=2977629 RepID=A0ABT6CT53_9MICC|nr:HAMP domain-containing sensor histidine kinase [Arthrobacter vasquezii]MDF9277093.1 HAMP domain-containing sensor histidine kinase [Arthrobacter vasquezii]